MQNSTAMTIHILLKAKENGYLYTNRIEIVRVMQMISV